MDTAIEARVDLSIRDIAAASGANVAHVKYYFNSKANLFEIIFDEAFEILVKRIFTTLGSDIPFLEMIEKWINIYYEILPEYPQIPIFILNEINHSPNANQINRLMFSLKLNEIPVKKTKIGKIK